MTKVINIENRRYIGSKTRLRDWIISTINNKCKTGGSFADILAGTGTVAAGAAKDFEHLIINDILYSNYVCHQAFFGKGRFSLNKIGKVVDEYNKIDPKKLRANYFSKNFSNKYFSTSVAKLIGHIRENIEIIKKDITPKEYYILLASLIYSIDRVANTVGHYDAYIKKEPKHKELKLGIVQPLKTKRVDIYRTDTNQLTNTIRADVVYIDPPYNSRQYSRFYHLLETLVKWNKPDLYGVALKPETENTSDYCKTKAPLVFEDLIKKLNCKYIVVSYNNTYNSKSNSSRNKIKLEEIKKILKTKGNTTTFTKKHRFFNSGKTDFNNHREWLFVTKVYG